MIDPNPKLTEQQALNDVAFKTLIEALPDTTPFTGNAENDSMLAIHCQSAGGAVHYTTVFAMGYNPVMAAGLINASEHDSQIRQAVMDAARYLQEIHKDDQPVSPEDLQRLSKIQIAQEVPDVYYPPAVIDEPEPETPEEVTEDLFQDMPLTGVLESINQWTRSSDEITADRIYNWFTAQLGTKTNGKDLFLAFQMATPIVIKVQRELNQGEISECTLEGNISFGAGQPNNDLKKFDITGEGGQFLDIEDAEGLVIARLAPRQRYVEKVGSLVGNDKAILADVLLNVKSAFASIVKFSIVIAAGKAMFQYGEYATVIAPLFNPSANWKQPAKLTITLWQGKAGATKRELVLSELKFRSKR